MKTFMWKIREIWWAIIEKFDEIFGDLFQPAMILPWISLILSILAFIVKRI